MITAHETLLSELRGMPQLTPPRGVSQPLTVLLAGRLSALAEPAERDAQMRGLLQALPAAGINARPWRPWEDSLAGVDCLHLFGSSAEHIAVAEGVKRQGVKVVLSPLAWSDGRNHYSPPRPFARRVTAWAGAVSRSVWLGLRSWRRELFDLADLLVPNSNAEAQHLMRHFHVSAQRIHIVPFGADPQFAQADPEPFARLFGLRQFVLHAGPIKPRNNQLGFLWAMHDANLPVVILGNAVPGSEWYLDECRRMASPHVRFLPSLEHDDALLASAYAACGCLVLPGGLETAGLAALEAGMSGTPLVLAEGGCAGEYFGRQAIYTRPNDMPGIRHAVLTALARGRSKSLAQHVRTWFSYTAAAKAMREAYRKVLREA
jgi:glycosyltransferase involved in cell wall biosynthesis